MTIDEYWQKELEKVNQLVPPNEPTQITAALIIARQLREIITKLTQIEDRLGVIETEITNQ